MDSTRKLFNQLAMVSSNEPLYIVCRRSGGRSKQACEKFLASGITNVINVEGELWRVNPPEYLSYAARNPFHLTAKCKSLPDRSSSLDQHSPFGGTLIGLLSLG